MSQVLSAFDVASMVLGALTIPVLILAIASQIRRRSVGFGRQSVLSIASMVLVLAAVVVGIGAARRSGVPLRLSAVVVASFVLLCVLMRLERRFWIVLALLTMLYTAIGAVSLSGFSHNYEGGTGGGRMVLLLVSWGGPAANPAGPHHQAALATLALLRYGVPLAATVAVGWVLASRTRMTRLERLALLLVAGSFLSEVLLGATMSAFFFILGAYTGLPLPLAVAGALASIVLLLTVGPGAVSGIIIGLPSLFTRARSDASSMRGASSTIHDVVSTPGGPGLGSEGPEEPLLPSLGGYLRGNVGWIHKLNIVGLVLAAGLAVLVYVSAIVGGVPTKADEFTFQYVDHERALDQRVSRTWAGPDDTIWLVGRDDRLRSFDPATGSVTEASVPVRDAVALSGEGDDGALVAVTAEATPRVVEVRSVSAGVKVLTTLRPGARGLVAVAGDTVYAGEEQGRILAIRAGDGEVLKDEAVSPLEHLVVDDGRLYAIQSATETSATSPTSGVDATAVPLDPTTLAPGAAIALVKRDGILVGPSAFGYSADFRQVVLPLTSRDSYAWSPGTDDAGANWLGGDKGVLVGAGLAGGTEYRFHYRWVLGIYEIGGRAWMVADDSGGLPLTPRAEATSYVFTWPDAPPPSGGRAL